MTRDSEGLFRKYTSSDALGDQPRALAEAIEKYDEDAILTANIDELVDYFVDKYRIDVPRLHEDEITVSQQDERYDARRDANRVIFDSSRPVYIPGTRFTFHVPYEGGTALLHMRANTFSVNAPRAVVTESELQFPYTTADANEAPRLKEQFERELGNVRQHLSWLENDFRPFVDGLPALTRQLIDKRRQKLTADRGVVANLGYKVRERRDAPKTYSVPTQRRGEELWTRSTRRGAPRYVAAEA